MAGARPRGVQSPGSAVDGLWPMVRRVAVAGAVRAPGAPCGRRRRRTRYARTGLLRAPWL
eukprot:4410912-Prymnesium_polylepis.1